MSGGATFYFQHPNQILRSRKSLNTKYKRLAQGEPCDWLIDLMQKRRININGYQEDPCVWEDAFDEEKEADSSSGNERKRSNIEISISVAPETTLPATISTTETTAIGSSPKTTETAVAARSTFAENSYNTSENCSSVVFLTPLTPSTATSNPITAPPISTSTYKPLPEILELWPHNAPTAAPQLFAPLTAENVTHAPSSTAGYTPQTTLIHSFASESLTTLLVTKPTSVYDSPDSPDCVEVDVNLKDQLENLTEHIPLCPPKSGRAILSTAAKGAKFNTLPVAPIKTESPISLKDKLFEFFNFLRGKRENYWLTDKDLKPKVVEKPVDVAEETVSPERESVEENPRRMRLLELARKWKVENVLQKRKRSPVDRPTGVLYGEAPVKPEVEMIDKEKRFVGRPAFKKKKNKQIKPPHSRNIRHDTDENEEYEYYYDNEAAEEPLPFDEVDTKESDAMIKDLEEVVEDIKEDSKSCGDDNTLLDAQFKVSPGLSELLKNILEPGEKKLRITDNGGTNEKKKVHWEVNAMDKE